MVRKVGICICVLVSCWDHGGILHVSVNANEGPSTPEGGIRYYSDFWYGEFNRIFFPKISRALLHLHCVDVGK